MNHFRFHTIALVVTVLLVPTTTWAVPVKGLYQDNPATCDVQPTQTFGHELGDAAVFPPDEAILVQFTSTNFFPCVPDDGFPNDFQVTITNITPYSWRDLFLVADGGVTVGNADGGIEDTATPGFNDAFKIDNVGVNNNLITGDTNNNLVFDPGEAWEFVIVNLVAPANYPPFPSFISPGGFSNSSITDFASNLSIVANRVPEPGSLVICLVAGLATGGLRRNRPDPTRRSH